jgi:AcrR family transcriptional regulator
MAVDNPDENRILNAAAKVFADRGFAGARVDQIAALAGVNKAMLYYRIGDKRELYRRVVLRGQLGFRKALLESMESCADAPATLSSMVSGIVRNAMEDRLVPSIIFRELAGRGRTLPEEGFQGILGFMRMARSTVAMGREEGTFRDVDPVVLQLMLMGGVFALALTREIREQIAPEFPGPRTAEETASAVFDILSRGILAEGVPE